MSVFLRVFQHLLPNGQAWRTTIDKNLRRYFAGLADFVEDEEGPRAAVDAVYADAFPSTASLTALREWEDQFGLEPNVDEQTRRLALAAEWAAGGGQSIRYIQDVLDTAGFDVFLHEWWDPNQTPFFQPQCGEPDSQCGEPLAVCAASGVVRFVRNPRLYTNDPQIGTVQCGEPFALCGEPQAICDDFLANETNYLWNETLTRRAPPRIPNDPDKWHYFFYVGPETFPTDPSFAAPLIEDSRRAEFERLLLKLRPLQQWIVLLVSYTDGFLITEADEPIISEGDDNLIV